MAFQLGMEKGEVERTFNKSAEAWVNYQPVP